ncbi:Hypothetical Protein FCC1311_084312 [Hondaea fermentalgiana]|uniref:Uncharacterized protein n=1 Tax=Hondaea fermentalgiana TaxID=2315210 RepID=A0A2R5GMT9_9STRA|nr:Hypothetical Protein FCC1311_084312 [Hondaea fermentalgiana]|eukprot:GBG32206.1 Hypothetical Protein FCC1311_084312 [Hondaea fermentalgiana]
MAHKTMLAGLAGSAVTGGCEQPREPFDLARGHFGSRNGSPARPVRPTCTCTCTSRQHSSSTTTTTTTSCS